VLEHLLPALGHGRGVVAFTAFAFAFAPALLIGFSVPLFSVYARHHLKAQSSSDAFNIVYWIYNLGGAACVLAMEYGLLRALGVKQTLMLLAMLNLVSAVVLRRLEPPREAQEQAEHETVPRRWVVALFLASALSGLFQLFLLKVTEIVFGPFHENFALVLALGLAGIALGTWRAHRWRLRFESLLLLGAAAVGASVLLLQPLIHAWGYLNVAFGVTPLLSSLCKVLVLTAMGLVPLTVFGATVPALLGQLSGARGTAGRMLAVSSFGNCLGYVLSVVVLYENLSFRTLALLFPAGLWLLGLAVREGAPAMRQLPRLAAAPLLVLLAGVSWSDTLMQLSYRDFTSAETLSRTLAGVHETVLLKRFDSALSLVRDKQGEESVIINGYRSLVSSRSGRTNLSELIVGTSPALYAPRRERALVLGVGTGITAGATASLFAHTDGVEINPAVAAALPRFSPNNLGLTSRPGFELHIDDGLTALARTHERYDAIVNTVTSPLYFSSSKLYTREFFELVKSRLVDGGVYSMWFDARVQPEGARIVFETLRESFADCHFVFLTSVYTQVVCGMKPLSPRPLPDAAWPKELVALFDAHKLGVGMNELFSQLILRKHQLFETDWQAPLNTFDQPELEFIMASASLTQNTAKPWSPLMLAHVDLTVPGLSGEPLSREALGTRCAILQAVSHSLDPICRQLLTEGGRKPMPLAYVERMLEWAGDEDAPRTRLAMAASLAEYGQKERALSVLDSLEASLGNDLQYRVLRLDLMLQLGRPVTDEALLRLYRDGPLVPEVRRILARVAASRGLNAEALAHLEYLGRLGPMKPDDQALRESLRQKLAGGATP
jgi:spermidine synthase